MVVILISKPSGSGEQWLGDPSLISFPIHLSHLMARRSKGTQSRAFVTSEEDLARDKRAKSSREHTLVLIFYFRAATIRQTVGSSLVN